MILKGGERENRIYIIIAVIIIVVIIFTIFFSTNTLKKAFIEDSFLDDSWFEDIIERREGSQLFGLENWASFTYKNDNLSYPAYVTVTSIKLLFMMNEEDLLEKTEDTIKRISEQGIFIDISSRISDKRELKNGHKTTYVIYDGNDTSEEPSERIKIIGETWNCGNSGTSIICIGVAQVTDNASNNSKINIVNWERIIGYQNGLIYNVKCH
ncbi:MAG: hypothetical protein JSU91_01360 [Thermoplasmatales archaeon]|nr:MAG: hypothetical protein JSU91_01360 [Thermoplasmatales archaeon]